MPVIPAMTIPPASTVVDPAELCDEGLFHPVNPPDSLEILNGGLDKDNWDPTELVPAEAFQTGTFARGFFIPFDRFEYVYAKQLANNDNIRVRIASLCSEFFLPWDASVVLYGIQAYCRHDATKWDNFAAGAGPFPESWTLQTRVDGTQIVGLDADLHAGRLSSDDPFISPPWPTLADDPGKHIDSRWPWVTKNHLDLSMTKGNHTVVVSTWMKCYNPDPQTAKLALPTGGLWVLALR